MSFLEHDNDAVTLVPEMHKVVFEDDKLRVLEVNIPIGASAQMHWHPRNINYVQSGGTLRFTKEDGSAVDITLSSGQVTSSDVGSHAVENIGDMEVRTIQVELKA